MAAVLESVTVPRATGFRSSPRKIGTSVSALSSSSGKAACLPEFRGLKIQLQPPSRMSASSVSSRHAKVMSTRRGGIVCETKETAVEVPIVTDKTWKSLVLESDLPVLVDFWAPWCGPCRMIQPIIGELAQQYAGKLMCYKLNTDESPSIATEYGIRSIPTVIIFKNGEKKDAIIGAVPKSTLGTSIEKLL